MYPQVFGKYVLERELSRGGMARVLLATLRGAGGFEKKLVVKQIRDELSFDQQFVRRFVEEAKTTVALSHPNIVPVYELGVEQGTYFLAMELVEGASIAELLRDKRDDGSRRVLTPEEGAYVGVEVCRALDYAHRRMKVVHRDITPRNVMLDEEGQVKLIDFGIAAPARVAGHEILGSPGHMPPEQVAGHELGPPTDIFAVAVLLMEAWTGAAPFRRKAPEECEAAMRGPHPRPSDFDPRLRPLDEAIERAMNLDAAARQQEAGELGRSLRKFLQGVDTTDVARALGDRVRELSQRGAAPPSSAAESHPRKAAASHGDLGTKTFATRAEALVWTTPREEFRPVLPPKAKPDPALSIPTPLMIETSEILRESQRPTARPVAGPPKADRANAPIAAAPPLRPPEAETIATRPLETPSRPEPPTVRPTERSRWIYVAVGMVTALSLWAASNVGRAPAPSAPPPPVPAAVPPSAALPLPPEPAKAGSDAPPSPPASAKVQTPRPSPSSAPSAARVEVAFVGDPDTRVSIDGVPRGRCPVRMLLDPGQHEAYFTFTPTGESRGQSFAVKSGDKLTVRADFTAATPVIHIQR